MVGGDYVGGIEGGLPRALAFPEWYNMRRAGNKSPGTDHRSFELSKPVQRVDQQWIDTVMKHMEAQRQ